MWLRLTCSRCGKHRRISDRIGGGHATRAVAAGWRSYGTALYCPECADTWHERNDKPLNPKDYTIDRIVQIQVLARLTGGNR